MSNTSEMDLEQGRRCDAAGEWLLRLNELDVSEDTLAEWVEWCDSDSRNLRAFEEVQSLWRAAAEHPPDAQQLARLLHPDDPPRKPRSGRTRRRWLALAASVAALCAVGFLLIHRLSVPMDQGLRHATRIDSVQTPLATNQQAILPDGSHVELGARSVLDVDFTGVQRRMRLRDGQAFFRVKHDTQHPFIVEAGTVRVTAVGTAFDIRRSGVQVAVTVQEGVVEVTDAAGDAGPMRAEAGYQLALDTATGAVRRSIVDPGIAVAWRSGRLEFAGDTLDVVIASVNRYASRP